LASTGIGSSVPTPDTVRCLLRPSPHPHQSHLAKTRHDDAAACKTQHDRADMISNVEEFVLLLKKAGLSLAEYGIQVFAFVPDPTGYVTVLHKTDGSLTRCAWHNVPRELDSVLEREAPKGVRHVTVGVNGSYAVILNSGAVWWGSSVPARLHQLLEDAERRRRPVAVSTISLISQSWNSFCCSFWLNLPKTVSLSLISSSWYFVEFEDGATDFSLPQGWHNSINNYTAQALRVRGHVPRMTTSYNTGVPARAQTYPQYSQFGSFTPTTSYGGGVSPGPTPFTSNPYFASALPGVPQQPVPQQPVYNITNVYNVPQQQQQQQQHEPSTLQKYNGMFTLLGGALKLAGAVLGPDLSNN
jgi:hypothetical protein